jgi:hypothetical protein
MAYMRNDRVALDRPAVSDEPQNRWGRDSLDNGFVCVPDEIAEFVGAQVLPDVLHRVQLRRVSWQGNQGDIVGNL